VGDGESQGEQEGLKDQNLLNDLLGLVGASTCNVHLGGVRKMDAAEARQKARERKAEALGYRGVDD